MTDLETYDSVFIEIFGAKEEELSQLKHHETPTWDSLTHMELIATLEDRLGIMMEIDDIIDLDSYENGKEIIRHYGKNL